MGQQSGICNMWLSMHLEQQVSLWTGTQDMEMIKKKVKLNYIPLYVLTTLFIYLFMDIYVHPCDYNPKIRRNVALKENQSVDDGIVVYGSNDSFILGNYMFVDLLYNIIAIMENKFSLS